MKILGIETSCDETAASVVEDGISILSNVVVSQIDIFAEYGGVIPEVAARSHLEAMMPVVNKALSDSGCTWDDIDAIAVTYAPGLLGSLLVGTLTARTLAILHDKPLYAVHHLKSHVYANWIEGGAHIQSRAASPRPVATGEARLSSPCQAPDSLDLDMSHRPSFPLLALVVSGGHTQILYMPGHNQFEIIGTTHDDAVGECFDKVAKILGLPYPGGPSIALAASGVTACPSDTLRAALAKSSCSAEHTITPDATKYKLPHPNVEGLDFSFSGLKTAVLRAVQKELGLPISHPSHDLKNHLNAQQVADFAASFQKTAVDILVEKISMALEQHPDVQSVVVAGGVSANKALREALPEAYFPEPALSGDNGAMVAAAAYYEIQSGVKPTDPYKLNIYPRISIEN